jgi:hypothetical protein
MIGIKELIEKRIKEFKDDNSASTDAYRFPYSPMKKDYMAVIDSVLPKLGYIENELVRNDIISTELEIKGLLDSFSTIESISKKALETDGEKIKKLKNLCSSWEKFIVIPQIKQWTKIGQKLKRK